MPVIAGNDRIEAAVGQHDIEPHGRRARLGHRMQKFTEMRVPERQGLAQYPRSVVVDADDHDVVLDRVQCLRAQKAKLDIEDLLIERADPGEKGKRRIQQQNDDKEYDAHDLAKSSRAATELEKNRAEFARQKQEITRLEMDIGHANENYKSRLALLEGESNALRQELAQAQRQLAQSQRDVAEKKSAAAEAERRLVAMQQDLARQKAAPSPPDPGRIKALEAELDKNRAEFARQKQEIKRLETDVAGYKEKVTKLETKPTPVPAPRNVSMAPPSIQIIDPPVVITRDSASVKVRSGVGAER